MANNIPVTPGAGAVVATEEIGGVQFQKIKPMIGAEGSASYLEFGQKPMSTSLPVAISSNQSTLPINQVTNGYDPVVTFNRPADTTAYAAGDVVGGVLQFTPCGPSSQSIMLLGAQLEIDRSDIPAGMTSYRLHLYSVTPPSALADNAPWDLAAGDRSAYRGYVDLGAPADFGSTLYVEQNSINKQVRLVGVELYAYLVTNSAYTPAASTAHKITLHNVAV